MLKLSDLLSVLGRQKVNMVNMKLGACILPQSGFESG